MTDMLNASMIRDVESVPQGIECQYYLPKEFNNKFSSSESSLSLLHLNARSLNRNLDSVKDLLLSLNYPFSVIGITESWLKAHSPPLFDIDGYQTIRVDRHKGRGGGVILYIRTGITFKILEGIMPISQDTECIFVEIGNTTDKKIVIGLIYRSPHTSVPSFIYNLEQCLYHLSKKGRHIYIMGDLNINLMLNENELNDNDLLTAFNSYTLYPLINKPTRISSTSATLIDNIFTNVCTEFSSGVLYSDVSDHLPIFAVINKQTHNKIPNHDRTVRKYTDENINASISDLARVDWSMVFDEKDNVDEAYSILYDKINSNFNANIPCVEIKNNRRSTQRKPWITKGILRSIHKKNRLYKKCLKHSNCQTRWEKYKKYRNKLTSIIKFSRKKYYGDKLSKVKGDISSTWRFINDLIGKKKKTLQSHKKCSMVM